MKPVAVDVLGPEGFFLGIEGFADGREVLLELVAVAEGHPLRF